MRDEPCPDCGVVLQQHKADCLTHAVEQGLMTPRQAQVLRYEAAERAFATSPERDVRSMIEERISLAGRGGGQIAKIVMGTDAWKRLATTVPNGGMQGNDRLDAAGAKYMGYDIVIDRSLLPDQLYVVRRPSTVKWSGASGSGASVNSMAGNATPYGAIPKGLIRPITRIT